MIRCAQAVRCSLCGLQAACLSHSTRAAAKPSGALGALTATKVSRCNFTSVSHKGRAAKHVTLAAVEGAEEVGNGGRLPVTILTGFLGSGKTTLLNTVLSQDHGLRIAIVENEFGAIDIDSNLIKAKENLEGVEVVESINGCICCTVRADLVDSLRKLMANKRGQFDHVIIETTGMADPQPIIAVFTTTDVGTALHLDGVVTMVDAKNVERHLDDDKIKPGAVNEALQQIAYADRVILNKTDLVTPADLERLQKRVKSINSMAQITTASHAKVPVKYVLGVGGFDLDRISKEFSEPEKKHSHGHDRAHDHAHDHDHKHEHDHGHDHAHDHGHAHAHAHSHDGHAEDAYHSHSHSHDHDHDHDHSRHDGVSSVAMNIDGELNLDMVNDWLVTVLEHMGPDLFRYKGILAIEGVDEQYVFQGVHEQFHGAQGREWQKDEKRFSRMVFIGRNIDDGLIQEGFEMCRADRQKKKKSLATSGSS